MQQVITADRGLALSLDGASDATSTTCLAVSRLGSIRTTTATFTLWVQLRGRAWVESKEGRFRLRARDWIAFDKDSHPTVQADRSALCVGVSLDGSSLQSLAELTDATLYPGRSQLSRSDLRIALRLWRNAAMQSGSASARPLLLHLAAMQRGFVEQEQRCPGRSRSRRRQVFGRMQRARLYLEGNSDRVVRISELAQLTNFSSWYVSKTFQSLYEESPQALSARLRLERASDLLRDTSMMIGEVAAASGFDNCCSFARAFRARFGVSASLYRDQTTNSPDSAKPRSVTRKATAFTQT
ncbi:helix-turn-helix domain-containing protein [Xanthomonas vesicatoria]|uniref:Transcriptional regulator n=1 Tax=Xanthomonas vesicatoria ATCC 35937 TaxID=925775 RepID=F0BBL8_9XANT|nr:helix-turn-helix transcriptional regulator [Xanthomonas vesicatoria]APP75235.1 AraC family transcriptional regulator [Xanthomonas vesicatoria ATCC 35937]EGD10150.1 transcriptional regulator [Xanthomonas vesicatoria ATCC 35937]KTF30168.1 AraC family transcriptional regulator [Xanthomonas vesicatoria]KTF35404.1 AraC family transcriptional regulator [Xanthomonas vesicatoria]MCC8558809.1 helix-turn-helix transcriptional regulator [Xanthomonas vesicatoria]